MSAHHGFDHSASNREEWSRPRPFVGLPLACYEAPRKGGGGG